MTDTNSNFNEGSDIEPQVSPEIEESDDVLGLYIKKPRRIFARKKALKPLTNNDEPLINDEINHRKLLLGLLCGVEEREENQKAPVKAVVNKKFRNASRFSHNLSSCLKSYLSLFPEPDNDTDRIVYEYLTGLIWRFEQTRHSLRSQEGVLLATQYTKNYLLSLEYSLNLPQESADRERKGRSDNDAEIKIIKNPKNPNNRTKKETDAPISMEKIKEGVESALKSSQRTKHNQKRIAVAAACAGGILILAGVTLAVAFAAGPAGILLALAGLAITMYGVNKYFKNNGMVNEEGEVAMCNTVAVRNIDKDGRPVTREVSFATLLEKSASFFTNIDRKMQKKKENAVSNSTPPSSPNRDLN